MRSPRWLRPGIGIKRWLLILILGLIFLLLGLQDFIAVLAAFFPVSAVTYWLTLDFLPPVVRGLLFVALGGLLAWRASERISSVLVRTLVPERGNRSLAALVYERARLEVGRPVVVIGGGTGLLPVVRALQETERDLNIKVILAPSESARVATQLREETGLAHNQVIFPTNDDVSLWAELENGQLIEGAVPIGRYNNGIPISRVFYSRNIRRMRVWENVQGEVTASLLRSYAPEPNPEALAAIRTAELVVIAPGRFYNGLLPLLAMPDIAQMIDASTAKVVFIANLMTEPGKTGHFTVADYLATIRRVSGLEMDYVVVNQQDISQDLLEKYHAEGAEIVRLRATDDDIISRLTFADTGEQTTLIEGAVVIADNLVSEAPQKIPYQTASGETGFRELPVARHDPPRLARIFQGLLTED